MLPVIQKTVTIPKSQPWYCETYLGPYKGPGWYVVREWVVLAQESGEIIHITIWHGDPREQLKAALELEEFRVSESRF